MDTPYNLALLTGAGLSAIAALVHVWVIKAGPRGYHLCGAGIIAPLPLLRPALCLITFIYLLRGIAGPLALRNTGRSHRFIVISSLICLCLGLVHLLGLTQRWNALA
ncbi:hypothetical protein [Serratia proteamaculans]|uniref:hypothetical protein n=1 Tax=Serratia proteamaculans TaxID=28151 RepID=UPI00101F99FC|nr:hypothetical protein [Serratia proteamaculans]RYM54048.1 hypothetical protein BSQ96_09355 [Serratia proteamaculans]